MNAFVLSTILRTLLSTIAPPSGESTTDEPPATEVEPVEPGDPGDDATPTEPVEPSEPAPPADPTPPPPRRAPIEVDGSSDPLGGLW